MRSGQVLARPNARQGSEHFASRGGIVSIPYTFVTGLQPNGVPRVHTLDTLENVMNSERPYSGANFELQLLSRVPNETQIGEATVTFAGDFEQK